MIEKRCEMSRIELLHGSDHVIEKPDFSARDLLKILHEKYENLNGNTFVIAVNKTLATEDVMINNNDTIALLPPFAGG